MTTLDDYQKAAMTTWNTSPGGTEPMFNALLGLGGEVGELQNSLKKFYFHQREEKWDEAAEELGDILYYLAIVANYMGVPLQEVARNNIEKLSRRHPNGWSPVYHDIKEEA